MKKVICGIYKIMNKISGKLYIGSAINIKERWKKHKNELRKNIHYNSYFQNAWNDYKEENFQFEIIEEVLDVNLLLEREQYWLDETKCYERDKGYNILKLAGNSCGYKHTEESLIKIGLSSLGRRKGIKFSNEHKKKISESLCGHIVTNETRCKIGNKNRGHKHSEETIGRLSKIFSAENNPSAKLTWEQVREIREKYKSGKYSQRELAREYKVGKTSIAYIINNKAWKE